ncbi:MAG TPA: pyridoxal 5'-phosphate synthase glutaminase subunit PdxT [Patescibacteria group bacterium]|nr:pyridoxal 5'-phosphate synthase glutaminase subunit PdxT [Patescibacteria group bacterium]
MKIGVLAFHGDVIEHVKALEGAAKKLKLDISIVQVRTKKDLESLSGLIIPGGESTTLYKLAQREGMFEGMKKIPAIFGTCAGAILLAREVLHKSEGQKTLELMDINVDRNAYGRQTDSFEEELETNLGRINAVYIRAPKILKAGDNVKILAQKDKEILACEEKVGKNYYLAACFHPELTTTVFHEYFLKSIVRVS